MRGLRLALLASAALAGAVPARAGAAPARTTIRVGYFHGGRTNLIYRAYEFGAFDAAGLDVRLLSRNLRSRALFEVPRDLARARRAEEEAGEPRFGKMTGVEIADLMKSGAADAGLVGESSFLYCLRRGDPLVAVAALGHDAKDRPGHALILRRGVVVRRPEDFKGLRLISRRAGPGDGVFLREFLRREGVDPSSTTIIEGVDDDRAMEMIRDGTADGGYFHLLAARDLIVGGRAFVYRPMDWLDPELLQALLVFRRDFVAEHPDAVQRFVTAYVRRVREEHARAPARAPGAPAADSGVPDKGLSERHVFMGMSLPVYDDVPRVRPELLAEMQRLLIAHGELAGPVDLALAVDERFVARAAAELDGEPGRLDVGYFLGGRTAILLRVSEAGGFAAEGVPVRLMTKRLRGTEYRPIERERVESRDFESKASGSELVAGLLAGDWDAATLGESSFLAAAAAGAPVVAVAKLGHDLPGKSGHLFAVRKGLALRASADYRGRLFVSRRAGPADEAFLLEYLERAGVDVARDVLFLPRPPAAAREKERLPRDKVLVSTGVYEDDLWSAVRAGLVDGGFFHLRPFEKMRGDFEMVEPLHAWADADDSMALLVCRRETLARPERRAALVAFLRALVKRARAESALTPEQRLAQSSADPRVQRWRGLDSALAGVDYPQVDATPTVDPGPLRSMAALLGKHGLLPRADLDPAAFVDDGLVAEAVKGLDAAR